MGFSLYVQADLDTNPGFMKRRNRGQSSGLLVCRSHSALCDEAFGAKILGASRQYLVSRFGVRYTIHLAHI